MAISYETALMDSGGVLGAIYDPVYGLHPMVGAGLGVGVQQLTELLIKRYAPAAREASAAGVTPVVTANAGTVLKYAEEISTGVGLAVGGAMLLSRKTKNAGVAALVTAGISGAARIANKYVGRVTARPYSAFSGQFSGTTYEQNQLRGPIRISGPIVAQIAGGPNVAPQMDAVSRSFGTSVIGRTN